MIEIYSDCDTFLLCEVEDGEITLGNTYILLYKDQDQDMISYTWDDGNLNVFPKR